MISRRRLFTVTASTAAVAVVISTATCSSETWLSSKFCRRILAQSRASLFPVEHDIDVINWSDTHRSTVSHIYQPASTSELCEIVKYSHFNRIPLRPTGSGLSPNAVSFHEAGMISLASLDSIVDVNQETKQATIQAGAKVSDVVSALKRYNLALPNYASISEQQLGGLFNVGAHGSGARIPPADNFVIGMKIVTPAFGMLHLNLSQHFGLLKYAQLALGALGVVSEYSIQCVDRHELIEHTFVETRDQVKVKHAERLKQHQHLRYMWIPYTENVVVVTCDRVTAQLEMEMQESVGDESGRQSVMKKGKQWLMEICSDVSEQESVLDGIVGFAQLRDRLLAYNGLDLEHVKRVNALEAEYWKCAQGFRRDWSENILGFDCGGQQWVSEVAFPVAESVDEIKTKDSHDMTYMDELLQVIEAHKIAAPAPIEQRWTSSSRAPLSPAYNENHEHAVHSWVGVIVYLPTIEELSMFGVRSEDDVASTRQKLTELFEKYRDLCDEQLWKKYGAKEHWAKIEMPSENEAQLKKRMDVESKYGVENVDEFRRLKRAFDPHNILSNRMIRVLFESETETE